MNTKKNIRFMILVFSVMFVVLIAYLAYAVDTYGSRWFTSAYNPRLKDQKNNVIAGDILDRNGIVLATTDKDGNRIYNADEGLRTAVSHVVGDSSGLTSTGIESFFSQYLLGFNESIFERIYESVTGTPRQGSNVVTSLDASLTEYASEAMGDYKGAIVVMNYKTGEILCSVSHPIFDPNKAEEYINAAKQGNTDTTALVNRVIMGTYTPGSVFKIITAAAALKNIPDIQTRTFSCGGPLAFDLKTSVYLPDVIVTEDPKATKDIKTKETVPAYKLLRDYNSEYHGTLTFKQAFAKSCNTTFAKIGMELGPGKIQQMAANFGIGDDVLFDDITLYPSSFERGSTDIDIAWSAAGQYTDLVTPLHMCMISAAIANDGVMMEPKIVKFITNSRGYQVASIKPDVYKRPLSSADAATLRELMYATVTDGTGTQAYIKGYHIGGKTGTAQVSEDENVATNAWFTGFVYSQDHPLAIAVVLEGAGTGGGKAAPVARKVLTKALKSGY